MVLAPHVAGQQVVEARDRAPPRDVVGHLEPLGVLVDHRVDDVDERLVAVEQAVPPGEQVPLEPALALVLGEHLEHATGAGEVLVDLGPLERGVPLLVGRIEDGLQAVRRGLVRPEDPEVVGVEPDDVGEPLAEHLGRLAHRAARRGHLDRVVAEVGQAQVPQQQPAVGLRVVAHPQRPGRRERRDVGVHAAGVVEELRRAVALEPLAQHLEVLGGVARAGQGNLVRPPRARGLLAVDGRGAGPALGGLEDDHRPHRALEVPGRRRGLDCRDLVEHLVEQDGEAAVGLHGRLVVVPRREQVGRVPVPDHEGPELVLADARQHGRVGDLVPVEVQDRQHDAVVGWVDELVRVPAGRQGAGLGLAVADDGRDEQVRVVERRAVGVREHVAELAALVDRPGGLGCDVARDAAGEGELAEEPAQALGVLGDVGVDLRVGAVEVGRGDQPGAAVAGAGEVDGRLRALGDRPVEVGVEERQAGRGAPVAQQSRLDVVARQGLAQQRVVEQVDLAHRQEVRRAPPGVDALQRGVVDGGALAGRPGGGVVGHRRHVARSCAAGPGGWSAERSQGAVRGP